VDRAFWAKHLEGWVPRRLIDAHMHVSNPDFRLKPMTEERRHQFWVAEVTRPMRADLADRCQRIVFPDRELSCVALGSPHLDFDIEANNEYLRTECVGLGWHALPVMRPQWSGERVEAELAKPGVVGLKPYYTLISHDPSTRDKHLEADIFDYLPHHALEVLDARGAWLTLHVPKADRLPHPRNLAQVQEIRRRYPHIVLVLAHLGRCYTEPHAREGLPPLAGDPGLVFDISAVLNPAVLRLAFELLGPERLLYGTDNPVFYMRGRRQWEGRRYINRTNHDFHFNTQREAPEIEATYTLYIYEALRTIKGVCEELDWGRDQVEAIFGDNARRLLDRVLAAKGAPPRRGRGGDARCQMPNAKAPPEGAL